MNYKKLTASSVFLLIVCFKLAAQNGNYELRNVVPPSATAASLGKYGEIPVGLHTGIPNISVPLYEIKDGPLNVPISLSYHAGGIRVEEIASSVGLGWTLNAGGIVGRQLRGKADELDWIVPAQYRIDNILQNGTQGEIDQMTLEIESGAKGGEADIYNYNFNGQSGKFFFDQAGTLHNYPAKNISISTLGGGSMYYGSGWQIITEDGTVYEFDKAEKVTTVTCRGGENDTYTTWYLTKIKSADAKRQIIFTYENLNYSAPVFLGETRYFTLNGYGSCLNENPGPCGGTNIFNTHRLKRIDFSGGYVKFNYNNERQDIAYGADKSLDQIEIYASGETLIKKYDFVYSYFGAGSSTPDEKRLKLTSVTEKSGANNPKPPYVFTYEESIQLPDRLALSTDHWGYYNGKANTTHIASFKYPNPYNGLTYVYSGADKNANPATMQAGILKKIQYPTGGETEFTYETNTTSDPRIAPETYSSYFSSSLNQPFSSITSPYETSDFTIPAQGADVQFNVSGLNSRPNCEAGFYCYLIKDNNTATPYRTIDDGVNGMHLDLPGGTYKFRFVFDCFAGDLNYQINLHAKIPILASMGERPVGGLRIKQIEDKSTGGGQPIIKKYRYQLSDLPQSSGVLVNFPEYGYRLTVDLHKGGSSPTDPCQLDKTCEYLVQQSTTNYPLATTQGSYVGYSHVVEDLVDNGEIRHTYNIFSQPGIEFPFPPLETYEWQRGVETTTKYYTKKNGQLVLSKEIGYGYIATFLNYVKGYKVGRNHLSTGTCATIYVNAPLTVYNIQPQFWALNSTNEWVYDQTDPAKYIESTTNYTYDPNHFQIVQVKTSTSSSDATIKDEMIVNKKYPQDYSFSGTPSGTEAQGIKKLKDLHIVNIPVEEYTVRQKRNSTTNAISDQRVVGSTIITLKSDNPYPDQVYRLETNTTIPLSTYGTGSALSSNAFIKNTNSTVSNAYKSAVVFNSYDSYGNLTMQQKTNDVLHSYVWGYNKSYPVAEVKGITQSQAMSVLSQSVLDNPLNDAALRAELDKIRINFPSAQTVAYTYKPLVGMTSQTDINKRTTYFFYDDFGRLILVKDKDGKILKKICYNYQGQTNSCSLYGNVQKSQTFTKNDCGAGQSGTQVTYIVPAATYYASTQTDADALAQNDVNANGQTYANNTGSCSGPQATVYISNYTSNTYSVNFYNTSTSQSYNLTLDPWESETLTLPQGTYNVLVDDVGNAYSTLLSVLANSVYGTSAYFQNVYIGGSANYVTFGD